MKRHPRSLLIGGLAFVVVLISSSQAAAQERVAVLSFFGPKAAAARGAARYVVKQQYEVVDMAEWQKTATAIDATGNASESLALVAKELGVKAIINGGVRRRGRGWVVSVALRDGATGEVIKRRGSAIPAPARAGPAAGSLTRALLPLIESAQGAAPPEPEPLPEPEPEPEPEPTIRGTVTADELATAGEEPGQHEAEGESDRDRRRRERRERRQQRREQQAAAEAEETSQNANQEAQTTLDGETTEQPEDPSMTPEGDEESQGVLSRASPHGWLELGLEVNMAQRDFSVPIDPNCDGLDPRLEVGVTTRFYSEIGATVSFYPLSIFSDRRWAHFGLDFSYRHHLMLTMFYTWGNEQIEVETEVYTLATGLTYRVPFIVGERVFTLFPRIGWGRQSYFLGNLGNDSVPPLEYDHVTIGIGASFELLPRYLTFDIGGHYLAVHSVGETAVATYNGSGERPSSHGVLATTGISGFMVAGLRWRIGFELFGFFTQNQGKGQGFGIDPTTLCEGSCRDFQGCFNTESDESVPIEGGIRTNGTAHDLLYRIVFQLSYRFGRMSGQDDDVAAEEDDDDGIEEEDSYDDGHIEEEEWDEVDEGEADDTDEEENHDDYWNSVS